MNTKDFDIRKALLKSGKQEFLARGFEGASLRSICRNANVTTGAFYNYFSHKEDLYAAIVGPMLEEYYQMYDLIYKRALKDIKSNRQNELEAIEFICLYKDEFQLLFEASKGTRYAGFKEKLLNEVFLPTYQACFDHYCRTPVDEDVVRIFVKIKFTEYMELIYGGYPMEKIKSLISLYADFSDAGIGQIKKTIAAQKNIVKEK